MLGTPGSVNGPREEGSMRLQLAVSAAVAEVGRCRELPSLLPVRAGAAAR